MPPSEEELELALDGSTALALQRLADTEPWTLEPRPQPQRRRRRENWGPRRPYGYNPPPPGYWYGLFKVVDAGNVPLDWPRGKTVRRYAPRVLEYLRQRSGRTQAQITKDIALPPIVIAAVIYKEWKAGRVTMRRGVGPKGGYGYFYQSSALPPSSPPMKPTLWTMLEGFSLGDATEDGASQKVSK